MYFFLILYFCAVVRLYLCCNKIDHPALDVSAGEYVPINCVSVVFSVCILCSFLCLYLCCNNDGHPALDVSVGEHGGPRHVWSFHVPINASRSALWLHCHSSTLLNTHSSSLFCTSVFVCLFNDLCICVSYHFL